MHLHLYAQWHLILEREGALRSYTRRAGRLAASRLVMPGGEFCLAFNFWQDGAVSGLIGYIGLEPRREFRGTPASPAILNAGCRLLCWLRAASRRATDAGDVAVRRASRRALCQPSFHLACWPSNVHGVRAETLGLREGTSATPALQRRARDATYSCDVAWAKRCIIRNGE